MDAEFRYLSSLKTQFQPSEFQDGTWFEKAILLLLSSTGPDPSALSDQSGFNRAHAPLSIREKDASRIITSACKRVVACGASSALVSTGASMFAVGTGMLGSGAALSTAAASLAVEMVVSTRIQIEMVYSLAINYGYDWEGGNTPVLPPALVLRMYHLSSSGVGLYDPNGPFALSPSDVRRSFLQAARGDDHALLNVSSKLFSLVAKPIGVKLGEQTVLKSAVPILSLLASSGWSYFSTQVIGHVAERELKVAAFISKSVRTVLSAAPNLGSSLPLQVLLFSSLLTSALLDGSVFPFEASVYDTYVRFLSPDPEVLSMVDFVVFGSPNSPADSMGGIRIDDDGYVLVDTPPSTPTAVAEGTQGMTAGAYPTSSVSSCTTSDGEEGSWIVVDDPFEAFVARYNALDLDPIAQVSPFDVHAILTGLYLMAHAGGGVPEEEDGEAARGNNHSSGTSSPVSSTASTTSTSVSTIVDLKLEFLRSMRTFLPAFDLSVSPFTLTVGPQTQLPQVSRDLEALLLQRGVVCPTCNVLIVDLRTGALPSPSHTPVCNLCAFERELKTTFRPSPSLLAIAKATLERHIRHAIGPEHFATIRRLQASVRALSFNPMDVALFADDVSLVVARSTTEMQASTFGTLASFTADTALESTACAADLSANATIYVADAALTLASDLSSSISAAVDYFYSSVTGSSTYRPVSLSGALTDAVSAAFDSVNAL